MASYAVDVAAVFDEAAGTRSVAVELGELRVGGALDLVGVALPGSGAAAEADALGALLDTGLTQLVRAVATAGGRLAAAAGAYSACETDNVAALVGGAR